MKRFLVPRIGVVLDDVRKLFSQVFYLVYRHFFVHGSDVRLRFFLES